MKIQKIAHFKLIWNKSTASIGINEGILRSEILEFRSKDYSFQALFKCEEN